jgi:hypothetical protein
MSLSSSVVRTWDRVLLHRLSRFRADIAAYGAESKFCIFSLCSMAV